MTKTNLHTHWVFLLCCYLSRVMSRICILFPNTRLILLLFTLLDHISACFKLFAVGTSCTIPSLSVPDHNPLAYSNIHTQICLVLDMRRKDLLIIIGLIVRFHNYVDKIKYLLRLSYRNRWVGSNSC